MALVIIGWLFISCVLAHQGIYILRTGQPTLFLIKRSNSHKRLGLLPRLGYAFVYLFPAVGMITILAAELRRSGVRRVENWVIGNFGMLFFALSFSVIGLFYVAMPAKMLRWTMHNNTELADNKSVVVIARIIGVGFIAMGCIILRVL